MNYLPRNRLRSNQRQKVLILLVIFILLIGFFQFTRGLVLQAISPMWRSENAIVSTFRSFVNNLKSKNALVEENLNLKQQLSSLQLELTSLELSESREKAFNDLLGRTHRPGEVVASILTHPPQSPYDLLIIDAGTNEGVVVGSTVALIDGPLIGTVSDTFSSNAKVKLYSSAGEQTPAILERGNESVILEGRGGGNFHIKVPREVNVQVGDRVVSAGVSYSLLAVVESVEVAPTDAFKEVLARSPANIFSIRLVKVLP